MDFFKLLFDGKGSKLGRTEVLPSFELFMNRFYGHTTEIGVFTLSSRLLCSFSKPAETV